LSLADEWDDMAREIEQLQLEAGLKPPADE
jgi:hypothetical protein